MTDAPAACAGLTSSQSDSPRGARAPCSRLKSLCAQSAHAPALSGEPPPIVIGHPSPNTVPNIMLYGVFQALGLNEALRADARCRCC